MKHDIFVYGTLKRGFTLGDKLREYYGPAQFKFQMETHSRDLFAMVNLGHYPKIVEGNYPGGLKGRITGEYYRVDREVLLELQKIEMDAGYHCSFIYIRASTLSNMEYFPALTWIGARNPWENKFISPDKDGFISWTK